MALQNAPTGTDFEMGHWGRLARRRWRLITVLALLGALVAAGAVLRHGTRWPATTTVAVQSPLNGANGSSPTLDSLQAEVDLANSAVVKDAVAGVRTGRVALSATSSATSAVISFTAQASTPARAVTAAGAFAASYQDVKRTGLLGQYAAAIRSLEQGIEDVRTRQAGTVLVGDRTSLADQAKAYAASLQDLLVRRQLAPSQVPQVVARASAPRSPVPTHLPTYLLVGLVAGLVIGLGCAAAAEHGNESIRDTDALVAAYRQSRLAVGDDVPPLVVALPAFEPEDLGQPRRRLALTGAGGPPPLAGFGSTGSNWYGMLATALATRLDAEVGQVVVVVSAVDEDGVAVVAANLAAAYARGSRETVLLGLDGSDAALAVIGLAPAPDDLGVQDVLRGDVTVLQVLQTAPEQPSLLLVPVGPERVAVEQLAGEAGQALLLQLRTSADLTIVAAPSLASRPEATVMAALADHVVLVVREGDTRRSDVRSAVEGLCQVGANVSALVLTSAGR